MDRRERFEDPQVAVMTALHGLQAEVWTALPGIIQSFDPTTMTCQVQIAIRAKIGQPAFNTYTSPSKINDPSGTFCWDQLPMLVDCPVVFPSGGGCSLTFPILNGDECLVIFASRCIDAWWQAGGIQNQAHLRMHDLSDGFVIPGPRSVPRVIQNISTSSVQLRTDDGQAHVEINASNHNIGVVTSGNLGATVGGTMTANVTGAASITAPTIALNGNVTVNGTLSQIGGGAATFSGSLTAQGDISGSGTSLHTHTHSDPQGGTTGAPI